MDTLLSSFTSVPSLCMDLPLNFTTASFFGPTKLLISAFFPALRETYNEPEGQMLYWNAPLLENAEFCF